MLVAATSFVSFVPLTLILEDVNNAHRIVLDEPTNYLDRDSLGALSKALKAFEGGVIIITHSAEFTKDLTEEVWAVMDGKMTPSGMFSSIVAF